MQDRGGIISFGASEDVELCTRDVGPVILPIWDALIILVGNKLFENLQQPSSILRYLDEVVCTVRII